MGARESVHNDADETVQVWFQLHGGAPAGKNMILYPNQTLPEQHFPLRLMHQICVRYKVPVHINGYAVDDGTDAVENAKCKSEISPGDVGQRVTYEVSDIIGKGTLLSEADKKAAEAEGFWKAAQWRAAKLLKATEAKDEQEVQKAKSEVSRARAAERAVKAKAAEVSGSKSAKWAAQGKVQKLAKELHSAESEVAKTRAAEQAAESEAAKTAKAHAPGRTAEVDNHCILGSGDNGHCLYQDYFVAGLLALGLLAVIGFKKFKYFLPMLRKPKQCSGSGVLDGSHEPHSTSADPLLQSVYLMDPEVEVKVEDNLEDTATSSQQEDTISPSKEVHYTSEGSCVANRPPLWNVKSQKRGSTEDKGEDKVEIKVEDNEEDTVEDKENLYHNSSQISDHKSSPSPQGWCLSR